MLPALAMAMDPRNPDTVCDRNDSCAVIASPCPGEWISVNSVHEARHRSANEAARGKVDCSKTTFFSSTQPYPVCTNNRCGVSLKNPDTACGSGKECVIVPNGGCSGGWLAVNKAHEGQYIKRADDMNSVIGCAYAPPKIPKPSAACVSGYCEPVQKKAK